MTYEELQQTVLEHDRQIEGLIRAIAAEREVVSALAASVVAHDNQIEAHNSQIGATNKQIEATSKQIDDLLKSGREQKERLDSLIREWQAYLRRLPPQ